MKKISLLGSTGSIGVNALKVIRGHREDYEIIALAAGKNIERLLVQIEEFQPKYVSVLTSSLAKKLEDRLSKKNRPEIFYGKEGYLRLAVLPEIHTVISAMSGAAGLLPTYEAVRAGKHIALANKETMVIAGQLVMGEAKKHKVTILPIDSEHSAILQSMQGHNRKDLRRIILTASGGPFRDFSMAELAKTTPLQALKHPNWNMGAKVSIDSATLMNKGLETIEAIWLFDLKMEKISILVHKQSIIHSMVEYNDGSIIAQLGIPDMRIPIAYALSFPHHLKNNLPSLELDKIENLSFEKPDLHRFKCLGLALNAAKIGGSMPAVLNGANEAAVELFLEGKIGFLEIPELIENCMQAHQLYSIKNIEDVLTTDEWARNMVKSMIAEGS